VGGDSDPEYTDRQLYDYMDCILLPEVLQQRSWQEPEAAKTARFLFDMEATEENSQPHVAFYVALTDDACQNISLI
jgi:hypothetical protein